MIRPSRADRTEWASPKTLRLASRDTPLGLHVGVLGKKWTLLILRSVAVENRASFSRLLRAHYRLSRRILSIRLKELQQEGYLYKIISNASPRRTAYALTDKGRDAIPLLRAFSDLVKRYGEGVSVAPGREVSAEDVCFAHPEIPEKLVSNGIVPSFSSLETRTPRVEVVMYKEACEKCAAPLTVDAEAYICSYACTWCRSCAERFAWRCPNCQGQLQPRARLETPGPRQSASLFP
jgi:DNA-binding HxlR family transcriptional regulator